MNLQSNAEGASPQASTARADFEAPDLSRIDHVAIAVWDADEAIPYYRDELDLTLVHDERLDDIGTRLVYLNAGNAFVQLVQPIRAGMIADFLEEHGEGLHHVCFAVPDIGATLHALPGEHDASIFQGGRGRRACFLRRRPNGALIELTEHEPR